MMSDIVKQFERIQKGIYGYIDSEFKKNPEKFVSPEEFAVPIPKDTDPEVIACYVGNGWKYVKGGPEDDCDYLRFK